MKLELNTAERDELVSLMESAISEVRVNVIRSDSREWREGYHMEEDLLKGLLARLKGLSED